MNKMDISPYPHCLYIIIAQKENKQIGKIYSIANGMCSVEKRKAEGDKDGI